MRSAHEVGANKKGKVYHTTYSTLLKAILHSTHFAWGVWSYGWHRLGARYGEMLETKNWVRFFIPLPQPVLQYMPWEAHLPWPRVLSRRKWWKFLSLGLAYGGFLIRVEPETGLSLRGVLLGAPEDFVLLFYKIIGFSCLYIYMWGFTILPPLGLCHWQVHVPPSPCHPYFLVQLCVQNRSSPPTVPCVCELF